MDFSIFTGFEGRINRAKWWLGSIILGILGVIISLILNALFGAYSIDPTQPITAETFQSLIRKVSIVQLITLAIIIYPALALMIKRLNDRDRPRWFAYVFWAPAVLSVLGGLAGLTMSVTDIGGTLIPTQSAIGWILAILSLVVGIWALVELGILKGTEGPNQHGPDPLAGK
jgi:uncharacterized membrane protein YhaH (DUF805 family)